MSKKIAVIFGGRSGEHEISRLSAASVLRAIDREKYEPVQIGINKQGEWFRFDGPISDIEDGSWEKTAQPFNPGDLPKVAEFAFPVLHGPNGEDGTIQGLFEMLRMPYAGCGVLASAACMDKIIAKQMFLQAGLPTCRFILVTAEDFAEDPAAEAERAERELGYPIFVKPANMGSSVGITKAHDRAELLAAMKTAVKYDRRLILEESVNCREVETGVLGNAEVEVACTGEIIPGAEFYDYEAKYSDDAGTTLQVPADIPEETSEKIRAIAEKAYKALDCSGLARCDFFVEKTTGEVFINEINTMPGFTKYSMFPTLFAEVGVPYPEQVERVIELGYERYNAKNNR